MNKVQVLKLYTSVFGTKQYGGLGDVMSIFGDDYSAQKGIIDGYNSLLQSIRADEVLIDTRYVDPEDGYAAIQTAEGTLYELVLEVEPVEYTADADCPDIPENFDYVAGV